MCNVNCEMFSKQCGAGRVQFEVDKKENFTSRITSLNTSLYLLLHLLLHLFGTETNKQKYIL